MHEPIDRLRGNPVTASAPARSRNSRQRQDAAAWLVVGLACTATFVALAVAGRLPAVDLPRHALDLQRVLNGSDEIYAVRLFVPYSLFFLIAAPLAWLTDAPRAIWIATALVLALVPLGSAALAASLRRSPALGLFSYLTLFATSAAWGFSPFVLGTALFGFALGATISYARRPTALRGVAVAALLLATYSAHSAAWAVTVLACWTLALVRPQHPRLLLLWPVALGTLASVALLYVTALDMSEPWMRGVLAELHGRENDSALTRVSTLLAAATSYGRPGALVHAWLALAVVLAAGVGASLWELRAVIARARGLRRAPRTAGVRLHAWLRRHAPWLAWVTSVIAYFTVPLWLGEASFVYSRAMALGGVLLPAVFVGWRRRRAHWVGLAAALPVALLIFTAHAESRHNAQRTRCLDRLAAHVRPGEAILPLYFGALGHGSRLPLDLHAAAELASLRNGMVAEDFADYGIGSVSYQPGVDRIVVPSSVFLDPALYRHAVHGREFTAWLLIGAEGSPQALVRSLLGPSPGLHAESCDAWTLVIDRAVAPGSHAHEVFLPHRHGARGCSLEAHADRLRSAGPP